MTQIKKDRPALEKKYYLAAAREMPKTKGKNPDNMCKLIFQKKKTHHDKLKQRHKNPLCIYWEFQAILKTPQYP